MLSAMDMGWGIPGTRYYLFKTMCYMYVGFFIFGVWICRKKNRVEGALYGGGRSSAFKVTDPHQAGCREK